MERTGMRIKPEYQVTPSKDGWYVTAWKREDGEFEFGIFVQVEDGEFYDEDGEHLQSRRTRHDHPSLHLHPAHRRPRSHGPGDCERPGTGRHDAGEGEGVHEMRTPKDQEITRLSALLEQYRRDCIAHERMVGKLYELMNNSHFDDAMDVVRDEYRAIHGPNE